MEQVTSFQEVNSLLASLQINKRTIYSLDNIKALMEFLNNPQDQFKTIHVAGTSGKSSTAYFMASLLKASGQTTGLTVSPIIDEVNERLQINLKPLGEVEFCGAFSELVNLIDKSLVKPSRFELLIALMYWYFDKAKVDYGVVEVGMGGLKDATNVITRPDKVCLITDIGYDHMNVLGNSLGDIASHKAGIIMPGNHVFMYEQANEIMEPIVSRVKQVSATLHNVPTQPNIVESMPDYQYRNWVLAYAAQQFLKVRDGLKKLSNKQIKHTQNTKIPGRMDVKRYKDKIIILDSAHNSQKMSAFISSFNKLYPGIKPAVLIATRQGKNYEEMAKQVSEFASQVIATEFRAIDDTPLKSLPAEQLAAAFFSVPTKVIKGAEEALTSLLDSSEKVLVITGSIYLISQLRRSAGFLK